MSDNILIAEERDRVGKGTSRALRREGRTPAVIYGDKKEAISVSVETKELIKVINKGGFLSNTMTVQVGKTKHNVLPRDIQLHPVKDSPVHVDFLRVSAKSKIAVNVPVVFLNEGKCKGLVRGGVLNVVRHEVELMVPAAAIPENIEIDLSDFDIGDSLHISSFKLPEDVEPTITDRDFTVATIAAPSGGVGDSSSDEEGEEGAEGEE
ncbi:50S ribosomal protein L25/general stress protein Ctc [Sneathiella sp. P13V-1]|uniref:50S ribosomal protein L25/general stress protein Ctc n=1 Tax=Sneathiella sp. P13V-1 TaxID=2697366 RepID=UPI00187B20D8|nr:50S ribosomal protein L25/general stress protein Ctc [Sneathiella sp. P13V-1]MBE7638080.1 50S ribosomal protein L25/general stress protein Ctc [Sneathiella sp. P13V-1]